MRLGGRLQAAIEILDEIRIRNRPASASLRDWGLSHRFAGAGDRSAIGNLVYDSLRKAASQAWRMNDDSAAALVFATLMVQWNMSEAAIRESLQDDRYAPPLPDSAGFAAFAARDLSEAPDHIRADVPQWCTEEFHRAFGAEWIAEAAALSARPPLDLRVNALKSTREKVMRQLSRFHPEPGSHAPNAIRINAGTGDGRLPNVQAEAGYQKGWFEIQDEGSQLAALLTGATAGEQVLDYCAGAGGKTLAMSAMMENRGQIHAHDADRTRLAPIHDRLKRAGARNVQVHTAGGDLTEMNTRMNCVLVDAPCSGSGTWRRRPDAKWRLDPANLETRQHEQDQVLDEASRFVKPDGRLVYVTCSMFASENAERARAFLSRHPDFSPVSLEEPMSGLCDSAQFALVDRTSVAMSPARTGTDGFFVAAFVRTG
ncbi:MAG: RsmB/NOP family class I SAM-dependent RNA methyltransferase [Rhizobiaceae bacterium]